MKFLIHVISSHESATRAALGLLVAKSAIEEGHQVDVFLAGDGASLARPETAQVTNGIGTGNVGEWIAFLKEKGVTIYVSGMSAAARGMDSEWLKSAGFVPSPPTRLVSLAAEADRTLVY